MLLTWQVVCRSILAMQITRFLAIPALVALAAFAVAQNEIAKQPPSLKISSGIAQGLKTHNVTPIYPPAARNAGIQGDVILQATIDTKGHITNIRVVQGDPILVKASIDAVKEWRYRPYVFNGEPVVVQTTIKIQFHR